MTGTAKRQFLSVYRYISWEGHILLSYLSRNRIPSLPITPLEPADSLSHEEILTTIVLFRFIHPRTQLHFPEGSCPAF